MALTIAKGFVLTVPFLVVVLVLAGLLTPRRPAAVPSRFAAFGSSALLCKDRGASPRRGGLDALLDHLQEVFSGSIQRGFSVKARPLTGKVVLNKLSKLLFIKGLPVALQWGVGLR